MKVAGVLPGVAESRTEDAMCDIGADRTLKVKIRPTRIEVKNRITKLL